MAERDDYFGRKEVSNSDLGWLEKYFMPQSQVYDIEAAYRFGNLIDAILTEPHRVNFLKRTVDDLGQFSREEFDKAEQMRKSFMKDEFCRQIIKYSSMQKITIKKDFAIEYCGFSFKLDVRCKWDLLVEMFDMSGDIKSTTATTQAQFEAAVRHFQYTRQRAFYMDLENRNNDMLIGISKTYPHKVFKVPIKRGSELYNIGKAQYQELAFRYWYLFGDIQSDENYIKDAA